MLTIRDRLACLIAALELPDVQLIVDTNKHHFAAATKYKNELWLVRGMPALLPSGCFSHLAEMARKLDNKLAEADSFPLTSYKPEVKDRRSAEAAMTYLHRTCIGGISPAERNLMAIRRIEGFPELLDGVSKARNLLALARYFRGDFAASSSPEERIAAKAIDALLPHVTDFWSDLLVIDRDAIIDRIGRGMEMWIWVKDDGCGTWLSDHHNKVPDSARAVIKVSPSGVTKMRRAPQMELVA